MAFLSNTLAAYGATVGARRLEILVNVAAFAPRLGASIPRALAFRPALVAVVVATFLLPGPLTAAFPGVPLTPVGLLVFGVALFAVIGLPLPCRRARRWLLAGLLLAAGTRMALTVWAQPSGLEASYWANDAFRGSPERFISGTWRTSSDRLDAALDLRGDEFPVYFFNDAYRFNFPAERRPGRDQLPFSVRWVAQLDVQEAGTHQFQLESEGPSTVWIDAHPLLAVGAGNGVQSAQATPILGQGWHLLEASYVRPEARLPRLRLAWDPASNGVLQPVGGALVHPGREASGSFLPPALATALTGLADALTVAGIGAWLALGIWQLRRAPRPGLMSAGLAAVTLLFLFYGAAWNAHLAGHTSILSGLDDWLVHESYARDILLNGPLMANGGTQAPAYYTQPLYPYALALAHWLTGESLFGPLALQSAAIGILLALTVQLSGRLFGFAAAVACLGVAWAFVLLEHVKIARQLFNENLYQPLVAASLLGLLWIAQQRSPPRWWQALLIGGLLGATAITREQFLLYLPFALGVLAFAWRRDPLVSRLATARGLAAVLMGMGLLIAPITARNILVSGEPVLIASSGGANLLANGVHVPPSGFDRSGIDTNPVYNALKLDADTRLVAEFIRRDPVGYARTMIPGAMYSLGYPGFLRGDGTVSWGLLLIALTYAGSFLLRRCRSLEAWLVHAFVGTSLLVLMLFEFDTYGYRLVLPMYLPMIAIATQLPMAALAWLGQLGQRRRRTANILREPALIGGAVAAGAFLVQAYGLANQWPQRDLALHGLAGPIGAAAADGDMRGVEVVYVASIDGSPRVFASGMLPGLRYPRLKWFDPSLTVPVPPPGTVAEYDLAELLGHQQAQWGLATCLGPPDERGFLQRSAKSVLDVCAPTDPQTRSIEADFGNMARILALRAPAGATAGEQLPVRLLWEPLQLHPEALTTFIHLLDTSAGDSTEWGNGTRQLYPASQWDPAEQLISQLLVQTDPTALPGSYSLRLGLAPEKSGAAPIPASWADGRDTSVPAGVLQLANSCGRDGGPVPKLPPGTTAPRVRVAAGGIELAGLRGIPSHLAPGDRLRLGLLWRGNGDHLSARSVRVSFLRPDGQVAQSTPLPLFRGRVAPEQFLAGCVLRDEEHVTIGARIPAGQISLALQLLDASGNVLDGTSSSLDAIASVEVTGRTRQFSRPANLKSGPSVSFGGFVRLDGARLETRAIQPGGTAQVHLVWSAQAEMNVGYKVFVHVLNPALDGVIAQTDAEPQAGKSPTTGWLPGEVVEDTMSLSVPVATAAGQYPVEIGLYDPSTGNRLKLPDGQTRVLLEERLTVGP